jgi:thiamine biosynthesis lipoprotein
MILRLATHAMGTRFELVLVGENEVRLRSAGEEAIREIEDWHRRLTRFSADSQLSFINRTATVRPVPLDQDLFDLLSLCAGAHGASNGAFDPTVGPVLDRLGLTGGGSSPGDPRGMESVLLDPVHRTVWFATPGLSLDLGGVAKGFALDHAARVLRESGVPRALLHGGTSSVIALGSPEDAPAWRIAVQGEDSQIVVELKDCALSVSAPRGRTVERDGQVLGHVIDPRLGTPLKPGRTAAVIGATGASTEAWSTALAVLGDRPPSVPAALTSALHERGEDWRVWGAHSHLFTPARARGHQPEAA